MMAGNHLTETFVYSGGSRRGARGTWASPYFWTKLRPEGPKKFFLGDRPPSLSVGLVDPQPPPPPPDPKVWIRHQFITEFLPRKREFIPRGTQKHKSNAFPFTRTVQTVQIANSPSPKNIYVTFLTLGRHVNALSHERFIEIQAKNPFEVKIFLKYKFLAALKHGFMKVKTQEDRQFFSFLNSVDVK